MPRRTIAAACAALLLCTPAAYAARIEGVDFAQSFSWRGEKLELTGIGLLRYYAGEPGTSVLVRVEQVVIVNLNKGYVIGTAPFLAGPTVWA